MLTQVIYFCFKAFLCLEETALIFSFIQTHTETNPPHVTLKGAVQKHKTTCTVQVKILGKK